jgi:hypothetical protein
VAAPKASFERRADGSVSVRTPNRAIMDSGRGSILFWVFVAMLALGMIQLIRSEGPLVLVSDGSLDITAAWIVAIVDLAVAAMLYGAWRFVFRGSSILIADAAGIERRLVLSGSGVLVLQAAWAQVKELRVENHDNGNASILLVTPTGKTMLGYGLDRASVDIAFQTLQRLREAATLRVAAQS